MDPISLRNQAQQLMMEAQSLLSQAKEIEDAQSMNNSYYGYQDNAALLRPRDPPTLRREDLNAVNQSVVESDVLF